ncbi:MAG: hypothetical protein ACTSWY_13125 [Promethearchaeota archaeon]
MSNNKKISISIDQIRFIASTAKCPKCGSKDVQFNLPFECHLKTKNGKLDKVVLDFTNPAYWLKTTMTKCSGCGFEFHLREHNEEFYNDLEKSFKKKKEDINKFYYDFDSYNTY